MKKPSLSAHKTKSPEVVASRHRIKPPNQGPAIILELEATPSLQTQVLADSGFDHAGDFDGNKILLRSLYKVICYPVSLQ